MNDISHENETLSQHILGRIQTLRPKLLDLTKRNPLLATRLSARSASIIRIVNTSPEIVYSILNSQNEQSMRIMALPPLHEDPADEKTERFIKALREARNTDEIYKASMNELEEGDDKEEIIERALKDRVRESLGLGKRQNMDNLSITQHAHNHNISPAFDLPLLGQQDRFNINNYDILQTLLLPENLATRINGLLGKSRTWEQETGIHVLHIAFGFLEWSERNDIKKSYAPLILMAVKIEIRKTPTGPEFWLSSTGEHAERNFVLTELLKREFNMNLPEFNFEDSINQYFSNVEKAVKPLEKWKVRRQIIVGVFPSGSVAMYMDLDLSKHKFVDNRIIKDLLGGVTSCSVSPYAEDYEVDLPEIEMKVPHLVMDADSSQISTIVDMVEGKNVAVEGPPGTGKSQTIVNAIATALDSGKKVLFVAEKMAALEVVKSRLEAVGLGEFILPLQAKRSSRDEVVSSIRKRVELRQPQRPPYYENKIREFNETRDKLGEYIKIISSMFGKTGITIYDIIGKSLFYNNLLSTLNTNLLSRNIDDIASYTVIKIENVKKSAIQLVSAKNAANGCKNFWRPLNIPYLDPFSKDIILKDTATLANLFSDLQNKYNDLSSFKLPKSLSLAHLEILLDKVSQLGTYNDNSTISFAKYIIHSNLTNDLDIFVQKFKVYRQITQFLNSAINKNVNNNLDE